MAFQFPLNPLVGDIFEPVPGTTYKFDGTGWMPFSATFLTSAQADLLYIKKVERGVANGVAALDPTVKVPTVQLHGGEADGVATLDGSIKVPMVQLRGGVANGLATLDAGVEVPMAQLKGGEPNGVATLDANSRLPMAQMPQMQKDTNAIIGGDFGTNPWQRGTSFPAAVNNTYSADRWRYNKVSTAVQTITRSADGPTVAQCGMLCNQCLMLDVTTADAAVAAGDSVLIRQMIEGYQYRICARRLMVLSFWHKHSKIGVYCVALKNSIADRSFVFEYTQGVADSWEYHEELITGSPSGGTWDYVDGIGLDVVFTIMCGTTGHGPAGSWQSSNISATANQVNGVDAIGNKFRIALVQLEPKNELPASLFMDRPFETEYALCRRYYQKSFDMTVAPVTNSGTFSGSLTVIVQIAGVAGACGGAIFFTPPMRASPSMTAYNPAAANALWRNTTGVADSGAASFPSQGATGCTGFNPQIAADGVQDRVSLHWSADADL